MIWRLTRAGLVAALAVGAAGWALERARFGASDQDALRRIESELRARLDASATTLDAAAARAAEARDAIRDAPRDTAVARQLFAAIDRALPDDENARTGITVYDAAGAPLAWAGRVSELPKDRTTGPAALFAASGALGPRLVDVEPIVDRTSAVRIGTVVAEQLLGPAPAAPAAVPDTVAVATSIAPVSLRARTARTDSIASAGPYTFLIPSPRGGGALLEAEVAPSDLADAHARWRSATWAAVWSVLAVTLLLCTGPLLELRRRTREPRAFGIVTAGTVLILIAARLMFWFGAAPILGTNTLVSPLDLLLDALLVAALTWLALDLAERRRVASPRPRLLIPNQSSLLWLGAAYAIAGAVDTWLISAYQRFLEQVVSNATLDVLHFSLHPMSASRLAVGFGLVLIHASVIWTAVAVLRVPGVLWRTPRQREVLGVAAAGFLIGVAVALVVVRRAGSATAIGPILIALGVACACAAVIAHSRRRARRASQAARLTALFLALLTPALAMYPAVLAFGTAAKERLVETEFGPEAARQREDLKQRLFATLDEIDSMPALADFVTQPVAAGSPNDRALPAFLVWSKTDLAAYRLKSAVELYAAPGGELVSRFALNLPEYATALYHAPHCDWDLVDEVSPFGSSERHVLRASRAICAEGERPVGSIVVRVMLDPGSLPFISSQDPYLESLRPSRRQAESAPGRDVELVVYGWSRAPIFSSGTSVWQLTDGVFNRLVASRTPFWATLTRDGERFRVYFLSDRGGIYALGYPQLTAFGHLVNLAELMVLTAVLFVALLGGATLFNALTSRTPASGRALLREIRSSFYRKLFIFFVAAAVVPVLILAVATRAYFAAQLIAGLDEVAARTATIAQRLVEDYATLQQRGPGGFTPIDDQIMVLVRRAIDQDANLFDGKYLLATSGRDLFASGLLPTRTPADVYRTIVLDRLPTFVGQEEVGDVPYRLAAAPVRAGGRDLIVTVPQSLRQQDTEQQIDELDRRVLFAVVLFSLLGAAVGYWMAERIADPVSRLTRATRRIARGDLDARIAATSTDELRRLVEDFNRMADDLKRQRADLERTQRLEAWADMARQVAHDIKNPLTPIQLSAEHARRVNQDRGRPLSPVLDDCVSTILAQVKLLRQISGEFSSFASSPSPRPEPARLPEVLEEVVQPYRTGLANRIAIEVHAPADLPMVTIDRTLLGRALTNVIENALHAMPSHGRLIVDAGLTNVDGQRQVVVSITDTGAGMDQDALSHIFEPYFSTKTTGTGLGLTIAKRNVELNGGTIAVQSERGVGTTVTIALPVS